MKTRRRLLIETVPSSSGAQICSLPTEHASRREGAVVGGSEVVGGDVVGEG